MLGHVHPDADVLGTLLALGLALHARGWTVVYGGPHAAPGALDFLPGVERYQVLKSIEPAFDVTVPPDRTNVLRADRSGGAASTTNVNMITIPTTGATAT